MTCSTTHRYKPFSHLARPREVIRQFTPNWFAATMGTGVLALALAQLPVNLPGLHAVAEGLWLFTMGMERCSYIVASVGRHVSHATRRPTSSCQMSAAYDV